MGQLQQQELLQNLQWVNSISGTKDHTIFKKEENYYLKHSSVLCVVRLAQYAQLAESKDKEYISTILRLVGRLLQRQFGLDHVYYFEEGIFVIFAKKLFDLEFEMHIQQIVRDWSILEIEHEKVNIHLRAGYLYGCPVDQKEIEDMYQHCLDFAMHTDSVYGTEYLSLINVTENNVLHFYETDTTDKITGLLTKEDFLKLCPKIIEKAHLNNQKIYIMYLNILNFKLFNDNYGYDKGNQFLVEFAKVLRKQYPNHFIARFEADHFYVMLYETDFKADLEAIQKAIRQGAHSVYLGVKAGICEVPLEDTLSFETYCDRAKVSADYIKKTNKMYRIYSDNFSGKNVREKYIIEHFREALEKKWIKLYFQPVIRTINEELCSMEVLARWDDPTYGLLPPILFIPVLEDYHLIHHLDMYIIENLCKAYRQRQDAHQVTYPVSFNLSRLDFELCDIFDVIETNSRNYRVPKSYLNIEITESIMTDNEEFMKAKIHQFQDAGYAVWIDDFGSEYSSLNTLKEYEFDELKIDMKFLSEFSRKSKQIIASIVNMAKQLGIQTLAEGVETKEQYDFLRGIGCEKVQGYYFSKPLPVDEMFHVLNEKNIHGENTIYSEYYDRIGRVDLLSSHPFDFKRLDNYESAEPLAIMQYKDYKLSYINANQAYFGFLKSLGVYSLKESEILINDESWNISAHFKAIADKIRGTDKIEYLDFFDQDNHCVLEVKGIASNEDSVSFLVHGENLSKTNVGLRHEDELNTSLRIVYSLFEHIYLIDQSDHKAHTLYTNAHFSSLNDAEDIDEVVNRFYNEEVYIDDRLRFKKFFAKDSLSERIEKADDKTLRELFRIKRRNGVYKWTLVTIKKLFRSGHMKGIVALSDMEKDQFAVMQTKALNTNQVQDAQGLDTDVLWNNILQTDFGIFWKDDQRRFLGANSVFKEYYEIGDDRQFIGKTDEELGWNVDPVRFNRVEERVLKEGEVVRGEIGESIVHGNLKTIVADKQPIYSNDGKIVGLLGYFREVAQYRKIKERMKSLAQYDELTDSVNSQGLREGAHNFVESYDFRHIDFALTIFKLENLKEFVNAYGYSMGEEMIKSVFEILKKTFGMNSLLGHPEFDILTILHQTSPYGDYQRRVEEVQEQIQKINRIAGIRYNIYTTVSTTYYSEVEDFEKMKYLGLARLEMKNMKKDHLIAEDIPQFTRQEIINEMRRFMRIFDVVRLVDPDCNSSKTLDREGQLFTVPRKCYGLLGKDGRCLNCISRKTIATHESQNKVEKTPDGDYFVVSRFVVVEGKEYSLELIKKITITNNDF